MKKILVIGLLASFLNYSAEIVGKWYDSVDKDEYKSILEIKKEENGKYIIEVSHIKQGIYTDGEYKGQEKMDLYNFDKKLRHRKLLGLKVGDDFYYNESKNRYENGNLYNPEDGETYYAYMWLESDNILSLRGYIDPFGWIGKTTKWSRVVDEEK